MLNPSPLLRNRDSRLPWTHCFLISWQGFLLLCLNHHPSLMAYDEGWYATLALGMVKSGNWLDSSFWGNWVYQKTLGVHWLIASALSLLGPHEFAVRLPSFLACLLGVVLTYEIGTILLNRGAAFWGTLSLSVMFLWVQYGQLATQDLPMVSAELLGIWALLRAEQSHRQFWGRVAGFTFGLGFWIKGFMVALPTVALLPYLIGHHRRHRHLTNPGLYQGLVGGVIAIAGCLWLLWLRHGATPFRQLFGILMLAASEDYHGVGPFYYLWNIPVNTFPWGFFALVGGGLVLQRTWLARTWRSPLQRRLLLLGYPTLLLVELTVFPTRTQYYPLQLYPFIALLAGVSLDSLIRLGRKRSPSLRWISRGVSYGLGGLGVVLVGLAIALKVEAFGPELTPITAPYVGPGLILGIAWMGAWGIWQLSQQRSALRSAVAPEVWVGSLLLGPWLALAIAGYSGSIGDYNPEIKAFLRQAPVAEILQEHSIDFVISSPLTVSEQKALVLLTFYTPLWGDRQSAFTDLAPGTYAWMPDKTWVEFQASGETGAYQALGAVEGWQLIQPLE